MTTPQGEQPFGGYGEWSQQEAAGTKGASRSALYFLIFAGVILIVSLAIVFYLKVFRTSAGAANIASSEPTISSQPAALAPSSSADDSSTDKADDARQEVTNLVSSPVCDSPSGAAQSVLTLAKASDSADDQELATKALTALSKSCGADYTLSIRDAFAAADLPDALAKIVASGDWITYTKPAPDGATDATEFTTPAQNVRCIFDDDSAACSIYVYDYPSPDGCEGKTATYRINEAGDVDASCKEELGATNVIEYGSAVEHNGFACTVDQYEGITCWNELTGTGFQLKREADRIF